MAANPRVVISTVTIQWDGAPVRLVKGQLIDVPEGSALEAAIGRGNLTPMFRAGSTALPPEAPAGTSAGDSAGDEASRSAARRKAAQQAAGTIPGDSEGKDKS